MQTFHSSPLTISVQFLFTILISSFITTFFINDAFSNNTKEELDNDIELKLNGNTIDLKQGIAHSDLSTVEESKLQIKLNTKTFDPKKEVKLQIFMARGKRPFAKYDTNFADQVEIDLSNTKINTKLRNISNM